MKLDRRERMKRVAVAVYLSCVLLFTVFVQAELPESLNIDCGATSSYMDGKRLKFVPDDEFIESGTIYNVLSIYNNSSFHESYWKLRSFPSYSRNCYRLKSVKGYKYLILLTFIYGNYDNLNRPPQFDIYIGTDYFSTVNLTKYPDGVSNELITVATSDLLFLCLINTDKGDPVISGIRLITVANDLYGNLTSSGSLISHARRNVGSKENVRYPSDIYDRQWHGWNVYDSINSTDNFTNPHNLNPPSKVLQTASVPNDSHDSFPLMWTGLKNSTDLYHIVLHFAELEELEENESREFNIYHEESLLSGPLQPKHLSVTTIYSPEPMEGKSLSFSINKTTTSTHPPLLNAYELFVVRKFNGSTTHRQDVKAIMGIKDTYKIKKNWMGDPCLPKCFPWSGLTCNDNDPPRIIALNLSNSGLKGHISDYLGNMSFIKNIDLSNNQLSGSIPNFLQEMIRNGVQINIYNNPSLRTGHEYPLKKKLILIIVSVIIAAFTLLAVYKRKKGQKSLPLQERNTTNRVVVKPGSENKKYSYKQILKITNNFENIIGKGGYGTVFSGHLDDGKKVAVKVLSESSAQGFKEFSTEINLLMKIHHRNLVSLVGYCHEDTKMVLIYEYMDRGNLRNFLSSDSNVELNAFSWEQRVRIALDVAQGLEYLHQGCQPLIIHRDVKTANILLNERLEAKLADFGLSKTYSLDGLSHISTVVMGTPGYIDPEYYILNQLNEKSDVYSFGVVLLELLTGEPPLIKESETTHIVQRVNSILQKDEITKVIDSRLEGEWNIHSVLKFSKIALECTSSSSTQRPNISQVINDLKECLEQETSKYTQRYKNETELDIHSIQYLDTQPLAR